MLGELPYFGTLFRRVTEQQNEIELLILVTPELVDAMDPHEVPPGGPGLNSTSPSDCELFIKGHIEVPAHGVFFGDGACSSEGQMMEGGAMMEGYHYDLPPGAVVPGPEGTTVAPGVTILSPAQ